MKIPYVKTKWLIVLFAITVLATAVVAAIASVTVNNDSTIVSGVVLGVQAVPSGTSVCPTVGYSTITSVHWGNVVAGSTVTQLVCLQNSGGISYDFTATSYTSTLPSAYGTISANANPTTIPSSATALITITWSVSQSAPLGPTTFTITIS